MAASSIHAGHRKRLYDKVDQHGLSSLAPHEVLEYLLFFSIPRVNTNEIAHRLIRRFGSLRGVIYADSDDLKAIEGVGVHTVRLLKALPQLCQITMDEELADKPIHSPHELLDFMRLFFAGEKRELCYIFVMDACRYLTHKGVLFAGGRDEVPVYLRDLIETILKYNGAYLVICHNHLGKSCLPSAPDNQMTYEIQEGLRTIGVVLLDHIIISPHGYYSYAAEGDL